GGEEFSSMSFPRKEFAPLSPASIAGPKLASWNKSIAETKAEIEREKKANGKPSADLQSKLRGLESPGLPPDLAGAYAVHEGAPADVCKQMSGDPEKAGPKIARDEIHLFSVSKLIGIPSGESGRKQIADWIASPSNPLTARVMVNRIWQWHFGEGLV